MIDLLVGLLSSTVRSATPLLLGALGGTFSERSGVVNIALEGIMLVGAFAGVYGSFLSGSALVGLGLAVLAGLLISALHAVASIHYGANQVISGTAINLLAAGFTEFAMVKVWGGQSPVVLRMPDVGGLSIFVYVAFGLALIAWWALYKTPWGLRLRSVGEHPKAADTLGVSVFLMRYHGVLLSGLLAGLAGASLSIGLVSRFTSGITTGRGFIALGAMVFGKWNPLGAVGACLLFGLADGLGTLLQIRGIQVPNEFLFMAPYIVTMLALAGLVGRATPPAASGTPYEKSH